MGFRFVRPGDGAARIIAAAVIDFGDQLCVRFFMFVLAVVIHRFHVVKAGNIVVVRISRTELLPLIDKRNTFQKIKHSRVSGGALVT